MRQTKSIFSDSFFEYIEKSNIEILRDEPETCYFPFLKGIVAVSQQGIKFITYGTINKSIWETQIIDFDIEINHFFTPNDCVFYKFISKICSDDPVRINYAISLIGYILHSYKDPAKPFAVILAEETDDESKGGGTGKGLFFQAIGKLIPVVRIDGKNFKPDKTFAFQRVGLGTRLVVIEDCPKNVDFERYYPTITEGITIEKKNQDEMFLAYSDSPKIAFTTNYTISNNAEHAKRRQRILEFSPFFSSTNTPKDFFGHTLFFDWDHEEWTRFYNFMFYSVKQYLQHGIPNIDNSEKLLRKQIKMQFGEDFLEYYSDLVENYIGKDLSISSEYQNFLKLYELEKKDYSLKRFKKGIQISSKILGFEYHDYINRQSGNTKLFKIIKSIEANPVDGWKAVDGDEIDEIFNL